MSQIQRNLGNSVGERRRARGWSRRELARRAEISERFLAEVERGRANPSLLRIAEIAAALGTTADRLLRMPAASEERRHVIALLGLRGAGKSTIGSRLAGKLGCEFLELDARVEQTAGLTLSEIFELHGPDYYRRCEREVLAGVLSEPVPRVLATGGGLVTEPATYGLLQEKARTVWLEASPEAHWSRVVDQGDTRPMQGDERAFLNLCAILHERQKLYQKADVTVRTTDRSIDEIVDELRRRLATEDAFRRR